MSIVLSHLVGGHRPVGSWRSTGMQTTLWIALIKDTADVDLGSTLLRHVDSLKGAYGVGFPGTWHEHSGEVWGDGGRRRRQEQIQPCGPGKCVHIIDLMV